MRRKTAVEAHTVARCVRMDVSELMQAGEEGISVNYARNSSYRDLVIEVVNKFEMGRKRRKKAKLGRIVYNDGSKGYVYISAIGVDINAAKEILSNVVGLFERKGR